MAKGRLFVVATPIGNLGDITLRALETLKRVSLIACEDTRETGKLLARYDIRAKCTSYHKFNELTKSSYILEFLENGEDVALVSDAGTPGISDPGTLLIRLVIEKGFDVIPIPGTSALITALSLSGISLGAFSFYGFLPKKRTSREKLLKSLAGRDESLAFFESPHRIAPSLSDMASILGPRKAVVCRELTKIHEEVLRGTLQEILEQFKSKQEASRKGEFTIIIEGVRRTGGDWSGIPVYEHFQMLLDEEGLDRKEAIKAVARARGLSRSDVYKEVLKKEGKFKTFQ